MGSLISHPLLHSTSLFGVPTEYQAPCWVLDLQGQTPHNPDPRSSHLPPYTGTDATCAISCHIQTVPPLPIYMWGNWEDPPRLDGMFRT